VVAGAQKLCFDTNALIYLLEGVSPYHAWLDPLFTGMEKDAREVVLSIVTEAELLVRPLRENDLGKIHRIQVATDAANVSVIASTREIAREAAAIRADIDIKLPDAIIVATAIAARCDAIVGNDGDCARRVKTIPYVYLEDIIAGGRPT
jgi:predicted nucleic acid-binding protein